MTEPAMEVAAEPLFDLARLDILTPSEQGRAMKVVNPKDGAVIKRADGSELTITLRGRNSAIARSVLRAIAEERAAIEAEGRTVSPEQHEAFNTRYLTALTVKWGFDSLGGSPFPCTPDNAEKLWSDQRFAWVRSRALYFVAEDGNFLDV